MFAIRNKKLFVITAVENNQFQKKEPGKNGWRAAQQYAPDTEVSRDINNIKQHVCGSKTHPPKPWVPLTSLDFKRNQFI